MRVTEREEVAQLYLRRDGKVPATRVLLAQIHADVCEFIPFSWKFEDHKRPGLNRVLTIATQALAQQLCKSAGVVWTILDVLHTATHETLLNALMGEAADILLRGVTNPEIGPRIPERLHQDGVVPLRDFLLHLVHYLRVGLIFLDLHAPRELLCDI
eukprot:CAMPEP_0168384724 /NCGR_PEP_ID=MMETSP0228-20121227/14559_1 /TAXON_ID=133427 /ORGANISM="Protoceratium reticulatum, Strain CCCM 535 (=CCMP 1889)" /LENGTH=156 /DNA_ID=CAMNT_0008397901 /DNA_START=295 /DNA_END=762 /DNA_ORIENTATION=-